MLFIFVIPKQDSSLDRGWIWIGVIVLIGWRFQEFQYGEDDERWSENAGNYDVHMGVDGHDYWVQNVNAVDQTVVFEVLDRCSWVKEVCEDEGQQQEGHADRFCQFCEAVEDSLAESPL